MGHGHIYSDVTIAETVIAPRCYDCMLWHSQAQGGQVEFWFDDNFDVYCKNDATCFHWVEIRYRSDAMEKTGPR